MRPVARNRGVAKLFRFRLGRLAVWTVDDLPASVHERLSFHALARHLNDLNIASPKGGEWHTDTVHRIAVSAIYLGTGIRNKTASGIYSVSSVVGEPLPLPLTLEDLVKEQPKPKRRPQEQWIERPQPQLLEFLPEEVRAPAQACYKDAPICSLSRCFARQSGLNLL